jgi:hypothetical protein
MNPVDGHRQGRGHEQHDRKEVGEPDRTLRVDGEHERSERHTRPDLDPVAACDPVPGLGI